MELGFRDYVKALEEERHKIQVFQRELPLCLELVTQAIERCKQQLSDTTTDYMHGQSECSEQTSSEGMTSSSDSDDDEVQESQEPKTNDKDKTNGDKIKSDWLRSAQLWNTTPDPPLKDELPRKALVMEVKRNGGAFQPFQREKSVGKTNRPVAKVPASAPATSSTTDTVSGGSGESHKKEEKDGQGQRKQRRNWSPELHRRFLHALQQLGGSHAATPKQIRELMKVDGLTNDEVKSHLQPSCNQAEPNFNHLPLFTEISFAHSKTNSNNAQQRRQPQHTSTTVFGCGRYLGATQDYAAVAATTASGEATRVAAANGIYAPVATSPSTVTPVSPPSLMQIPRPKRPESSHSDERVSHSEGRGHCNSTATSSSTHTTASPVL
ncbi:myb-like transcription factor family protein [Prunus dulcis]|uniref:Myb-like transcription factor family protein n=1 Tax=Prunus dulcis TaxID=3755 RepID=A0A4Y1QRJ6_PRUDU|nr:myb-like transcription factor family protein [Prunus dulcis]